MRPFQRVTRRALLAAFMLVVASAMLPAGAIAQAGWPDKPIKLVVPFAPGASTDTLARIIANKLSARLGQSVVVENRTGAGGIIGTTYVASQPADGYTLLFVSIPYATAQLTGPADRKPPYDPEKSLQPIGEVGAGPFMVVVSTDLKATTLRDFIELARSKPDSISYGSAGIGSMNHLGMELVASTAKIKLLHVPYQGLGPAITGLLGGQTQVLLASLPAALPHVRAGKMRAIAVTGFQRSALMPELPTTAEAGLPGVEIEAWWGLLGPAGLPAPIVKRLNDELNAVLAAPDIAEVLARDGATPKPGTPEDFRKVISAEVARWSKLIKEAKISTE